MVWRAMIGAVLLSTTPPTVPPSTVATSAAPPVPGSSVPSATAPAEAGDPLGCEALVFDPAGELDAAVVQEAAASTASMLGADLHVRAERNLDGGLDARMAQLESQCPTWGPEGERALNLVVVMYSSTDREASVFYGAAQAYRLEFRWEHAVDEMGPQFAAGDFTAGVVAGLAALQEDAPVSYEPTYSPTRYDDDTGSPTSPGVPPVIWLGLAAVVIIALVRVGQFMSTGEWGSGADDGDDDSSWGSSRRSSSWRSSSSSRRSFSSRSSSRSSSPRRSSGRAGGGTKKW